jgi:hypothetical protein
VLSENTDVSEESVLLTPRHNVSHDSIFRVTAVIITNAKQI